VVFTGTDEEKQRAFDQLAERMMSRMQAWLSSSALLERLKAKR